MNYALSSRLLHRVREGRLAERQFIWHESTDKQQEKKRRRALSLTGGPQLLSLH